MFKFYVFVSCAIIVTSAQEDCSSKVGFDPSLIVSDLEPEDCFTQEKDYTLENDFCLPGCVDFPHTSSKICNKFWTTPYTNLVFKPTSCAKDGFFSPKQCKGERTTGRCFCVNKNGKRIFGQEWWARAANMTCACSRRKADLLEIPHTDKNYLFFNSLHCNSMGNYEALQCDMISEQCWCAEEQTGKLISPVVPKGAMAKLPCYNSQDVGNQYLRQCENQKFAQNYIEHKLKLRGTDAAYGPFVCDEDGGFGPYVIIDGQSYCTWRDNTKIGSWSSAEPDSSLNCNCARDGRVFANAGKQQLLKCSPNGNYKPLQKSGDVAYCVDIDGYIKSPLDDTKLELDSDCDPFPSYTEEAAKM